MFAQRRRNAPGANVGDVWLQCAIPPIQVPSQPSRRFQLQVGFSCARVRAHAGGKKETRDGTRRYCRKSLRGNAWPPSHTEKDRDGIAAVVQR